MPTKGFRFCVYGGQFGSEGKGCLAEWLIQQYHTTEKLVVFGENAPNSGHTNSRGKTRSLPVSAHFADVVILGPDSAIDPLLLEQEVNLIKLTNPKLQVYVHQNSAIITPNDIEDEKDDGLDKVMGSTVTGGGKSRVNKAYYRRSYHSMAGFVPCSAFEIINRVQYYELLNGGLADHDWLFECSQGLMLDLNLGYYPYVTSRTTNPRAAIERNGLGPSGSWSFVGAYRTYPIRTGGNSGPTGGNELKWEEIGVKSEIATVTKRVRRVFDFSGSDFLYSVEMIKPCGIAFTHLDYLAAAHRADKYSFLNWLGLRSGMGGQLRGHPDLRGCVLMTSEAPSMFNYHGMIGDEDNGLMANPLSLAPSNTP